MANNLLTIGEKIKYCRQRLNITQKELGKICNIAESTIRRYELGKLNPKHETLLKISAALDVDINYFYEKNNSFDEDDISRVKLDFMKGVTPDINSLLTVMANLLNSNDDIELNEHILILMGIIELWINSNFNKNYMFFYDDVLSNRAYVYSVLDLLKLLNERGKKEVLKRLEELTQLKKYSKVDK